ncbi:hypothetical protein ACFX1Z_007875 [Malus domestica]
MHFGTRLDKQTRRLSILGKSRQWLKRRRTGSSPVQTGRMPSIGIDPRPRTTLSSQSRSTKSFATSRISHGSSCLNNQKKILPSWITPNTAHSTEVPVIQPTIVTLGRTT